MPKVSMYIQQGGQTEGQSKGTQLYDNRCVGDICCHHPSIAIHNFLPRFCILPLISCCIHTPFLVNKHTLTSSPPHLLSLSSILFLTTWSPLLNALSHPPSPPSSPPPLCAGCRLRIVDKYYLCAVESKWHTSCLKCAECGVELENQTSCFERDGQMYCKDDYVR